MQIVFHAARHTWRWSLRLVLLSGLLLALLAAALWVLVPQASHFQDDLARELTDYLHAPVEIARLSGRWVGIYPSVEISGFSLLHPDNGQRLLQFRRAEAVLDLPASLWNRRLVLRELVLQGGQLALVHTASGWQLLPGDGVAQTGQRLDLQALQGLVLRMPTLTLELDSLQLVMGDVPAQTLTFEDLHLALAINGAERELSLRATPPGGRRQSLQGHLRLNTDQDLATVGFFVRGTGLPLQPYQAFSGGLDARLDVRLRGQWNGNLEHLEAQLQLHRPRLPDDATQTSLRQILSSLERVEAGLNWRRHPSGWRGEGSISGLGQGDKPYWDTRLSLQRSADDTPLEGELKQLPVALLGALANPWLDPGLKRQLSGLEPSGYLSSTRFSVNPDLSELHLYSRFEDLSSRPWHGIPGLDGLDGTLRWDPRGGGLSLDSHFLTVSGQPLSAPVELAVDGAVDWQRQTDGIGLTIRALRLDNADLSATLNGSVDIVADDPRVDLRLAVTHLALAQASRYLPVTRMKPKLVEWLQRALVAGQVQEGSGVLQGRLAAFPFDAGQGLLELHLPVEQVVLDYAPPWPVLREARGKLRLRNREFSVTVSDGRVLDARVEHSEGHIQTLGKPPMTVSTTLTGPASSFLQAIQDGKAPASVKQQLANLEISGSPEVTVDVLLPFKQRPPVVSGTVRFADSDIHLPRYRLPLDGVRGELDFGPEGLQAEQLALSLHERPATLNIASQRLTDGGRRSRFELTGEPDLPRLLPPGGPPLDAYLSGRSRWRAVVSVERPEHFQLHMQSELADTALRLPGPLGKTAGQRRPITVDARMSPTQLDLSLATDDGLRGQLRWSREPGLRLQRGELRLNAGEAQLPGEPGIALIGRLPSLVLGGNSMGPLALPGALPDWFSSLDLAVDSLTLGNYSLPDIQLQLHRSGQRLLQGNLAGRTAEGNLQIPLDHTQPLNAELRWLRLPAPSAAGASPPADTADSPTTPGLDPRQLPPLNLQVERLEIAGRSWGSLELHTQPEPSGLRLDPLVLGNEAHRLAGSGDWRVNPGGQLSRLQLNLQSQSLGASLEQLGLNPQLSGAPASGALSLAWQGSLLRPRLAALNGELDLDIGTGQFLSLEPGSLGRLLGLMSLQSLGRRLSLDFSDVNDQGLGFDAIQGTLNLAQGVVRTTDLMLYSPAARVSLQGRVNLLERSLEQIVTVVPRIGTSLGIAGTLVGGPVVGAAVLAADALLPGGMGQVTQLSYRISGPWQDPTIERISSLPPQRNDDPMTTITNR